MKNRKQLAKLCGISTRTIRRWYGRKNSFDDDFAEALVKRVRVGRCLGRVMKEMKEARKEIRKMLFGRKQ